MIIDDKELYNNGDVNGLINDFGYKPDTDFADGIGDFAKWYESFIK